MSFDLRPALLTDVPALEQLIAHSIRGLGAGYYTTAQIEAGLQGAFGVDTTLIQDGTYFVAVTDSGAVVACGGWSRRRTLFGSNARAERDESLLDPHTEAARIRAFFVHPRYARHGLARALLERSESAARHSGFATLELMATLSGIAFYQRCGYVPGTQVNYPVPGGLVLPMVPMHKRITPG